MQLSRILVVPYRRYLRATVAGTSDCVVYCPFGQSKSKPRRAIRPDISLNKATPPYPPLVFHHRMLLRMMNGVAYAFSGIQLLFGVCSSDLESCRDSCVQRGSSLIRDHRESFARQYEWQCWRISCPSAAQGKTRRKERLAAGAEQTECVFDEPR